MPIKCLFCESTALRKAIIPGSTFFNNKVFDYKRCKKCGLVFINPIPIEEDYQKMYAKEYHTSYYFKDQTVDFSYLEPLMQGFSKDSTLLDYGCGDASFLKYFASKGYKVTGTEYDPELVKKLGELNPEISFSTIPDFWDNAALSNFTFIHLGDVLEHIDEPIKFLKEIAVKLNTTNSLLIVEGPLENNKSFTFLTRYLVSYFKNLIRPSKKAAHVPYHITFSNYKNQLQLFKSCGFEEVKYTIFETPWPYPSKPGKTPGSIFKYLIAKSSLFFSKLFPFAKMGNRFIYIGKLNTKA